MIELPPDWLEITLRLGLAVLLSAVIGFEREVRDKPAGLRTHMLVGLGAAAVCIFALGMVESVAEKNDSVRLDLTRVVSGVIGGLGFLGGGAILQSKGEVHGMTTAVGIWIVGAIGIGCGTGNYFAVLLTTLLAIICLIPVRFLEHQLAIRNSSTKKQEASQNDIR